MERTAHRVPLEEILPFRALYLQECNFQARYNAVHERGRSDSWLLSFNRRPVGYVSVMGQERHDRDTVFEFYVVPPYRRWSRDWFADVLKSACCPLIECQSNDPLLAPMLYAFANEIVSHVVLFEDFAVTELRPPRALVRPTREGEALFEHSSEPEGDFVVDVDGVVVASGGFLRHYNHPFADLYMEVHPDHRRQGYGAFLIQELKTECYLAGRKPAARCNADNHGSRNTLIKAGLRPCGAMLLGKVRT